MTIFDEFGWDEYDDWDSTEDYENDFGDEWFEFYLSTLP